MNEIKTYDIDEMNNNIMISTPYILVQFLSSILRIDKLH